MVCFSFNFVTMRALALVSITQMLARVCSGLSNNTVIMGILLVKTSKSPFDFEEVGPALDIAIEKANKTYNVSYEKHPQYYSVKPDDACDKTTSAGKGGDLLYLEKVDVVFGPACSKDIIAVALMGAYLQIPVITGAGDLLEDRRYFNTLSRLSYNQENLFHVFFSIFEKFGWRHLAIMFDDGHTLPRTQATALVRAIQTDTFKYPSPAIIPYNSKKHSPDFAAYLKEASEDARVIIIIAKGSHVRGLLLEAYKLGKTSGDYAFITIELFRNSEWGQYSWKNENDDAVTNEQAKQAFESLLIITLKQPEGEAWRSFSKEVKARAFTDYGFNYTDDVNYFVGAFHDGVILHALAVSDIISSRGNASNGFEVSLQMRNKTFAGVTGNVTIDDHGDRIADYSLLDMTDSEHGVFSVVGNYYGSLNKYIAIEGNPIHWPAGHPPPDMPKCGFRGEDPACSQEVTIAITVSVIFVLLAAALLIYRKMKLEHQLADMSWKVRWEEIDFSVKQRSVDSVANVRKLQSGQSDATSTMSAERNSQIFTKVGLYKGTRAAIKLVYKKQIVLSRSVLMELKQMRDISHDNIVRFLGACTDTPNIAILTEYCPKGSLLDILENDSIKLDWMFRYSLIDDVINGMIYLHNSPVRTHGHLMSNNCVVDGRFVLKLTDFGLPSFRKDANMNKNSFRFYWKQQWTAPELLRLQSPPFQGTAKGDVYSFSIILQEIVIRTEPYESHNVSPMSVVEKVKKGMDPPFRPTIDMQDCPPELAKLIAKSWEESPDDRPEFAQIKTMMKQVNRASKNKGNIVDNLLQRMEQYANNLEQLVDERTTAFIEEKKRSEELLYRVLPRSVAEQLKRGKVVDPESFDWVTIYFSDIVGFTALSASSTPLQVVNLLNDLYTCFDAIIAEFDVYKVETIGDAYMVVSGLPIRNGNNHVKEICSMSLRLLQSIFKFRIRHRPSEQLKLRIGIHSGPCVAGVVGLTMPRYCLFGDTVNTASRMESNGLPLRIHVSSSTKLLLDKFGTFQLEERGEIQMKGKGTMMTYWLISEQRNEY